MLKHEYFKNSVKRLPQSLIAVLLIFCLTNAHAEESICARVKIEIKQELTLERQAFDANMVINNGLDGVTLEDVNIDVLFTDENGISVLASSNPDNTEASFFIRIDSMDGINDVDGGGTVAPLSSADIHWLIIPAPGTGGSLPSGKLYYVGASLSYSINGEVTEMEVSPDYIYVKPLPELTLDYFLPEDVYADDAFTTEIESPVPFTLGVRVNNSGDGAAQNLKIESAQPKIVENEQGLIIDFKIIGSSVQDDPTAPTLLIDFGDIEKDAAKMGRWSMITTLSGQFVEFDAEFSHADELGGQLTSLIDTVNTHTLVRDVLVDLPGRDSVKDFLAQDGLMRVYESNGLDTEVSDVSSSSFLGSATYAGSVVLHSLITPVAAGFTFTKLPDPYNGTKEFVSVLRSDGKTLSLDNAWTSKTRKFNPEDGWDYFINVFDVGSTGSYTLVLDTPVIPPLAPVMQFIPDRRVAEQNQISFIVEASDPNGTIPILSTSTLPAGAVFVDQGNGVGYLDWTPPAGSAGTYPITFIASDGELKTSQYSQIIVQNSSEADVDFDNMSDAWEMQYFGNLDRDGTGDFDGDGKSDKDEFLDGTDPLGLDGPSVPVILTPADSSIVTSTPIILEVENSTHPDPDAVLTYQFEVFADKELSQLLSGAIAVIEGGSTTSWKIIDALPEDQLLYWRARAFDGVLGSIWTYGEFKINTIDELPLAPIMTYPADFTSISTLIPTFEFLNGSAPDKPTQWPLQYRIEVSESASFATLIMDSSAILADPSGRNQWQATTPLLDGSTYFWRIVYQDFDTSGLATEITTAARSFAIDTSNQLPDLPVVIAPSPNAEIGIGASYFLRVSSQITDSDGHSVTYYFELDAEPTFNSANLVTSTGLMPSEIDSIAWEVTSLLDNTQYYWRVKASDGFGETPWVYSSFTINSLNDAPLPPPVCNPGNEAWLPSLRPVLMVTDLPDLDNDARSYEFELLDSTTNNLIADHQTIQRYWRLPANMITDHQWYQWRARALDEYGLAGAWSTNLVFYVNEQSQVVYAPTIELLSPSVNLESSGVIDISWIDRDDDSDAQISLFYDNDETGTDGTLIVAGLSEDADNSDGFYAWDTSALPASHYYLYGVISDGIDSAHSYASGKVTVPEATIADDDGDGVSNEMDNCPTIANPDQADSGGLDSAVADGVGDACQCGEVNGDGLITGTDAVLIQRFLLGLPPAITSERCDVSGDGLCTNTDAVLIQRALLGLPPGLQQRCFVTD
ncbi:MAG: dockerin type I domain-containing protein [Pseudomonadales bacterium]|nr:dockerin type I domain-containing protein [Pseudomonadales bacterium]